MDDVARLNDDLYQLVRSTIHKATADGLDEAAIGKAVVDAIGTAPHVEVIASPAAVAPPSAAGLDIPSLISAIVAAVKPEKPEPVVVNFTERELPRSRTIIDRDVETGRIIGTHEEYVGAS